MKKFIRSGVFGLFLYLILLSPSTFSQGSSSPRLLVHLLNYLAKDYAGAVSGGKVIQPFEYDEQVELSRKALEEIQKVPELKAHPEIETGLKQLQVLIRDKADPSQVETLALKLQTEVITITKMEIAPYRWPDPSRGRSLYEANCVTCHGSRGQADGPLAKGLEPPPANFLDFAKMENLSPFQAYQTIRLGVPKTAMASFQNLPDQDLWDLAFYVVSLRYQDSSPSLPSSQKKRVETSSRDLDLKTLASSSDRQLKELWNGSEEEKRAFAAMARLRSGQGHGSYLAKAKTSLREAADHYRKGEKAEAERKALLAYLEGVEPIEVRLRTLDASFVVDLEKKMAKVRSLMGASRPWEEVNASLLKAEESLNQAQDLLNQKPSSFWFVFFMAASIILREGFEAVLIILAILGVLRVVGERRAAHWVHGGWIVALACGAVTWIFSGWVMTMSGIGREMMEGLISLFAVVVLLYVGFWLHRKTEIRRWTAFIDGKTRRALAGGSFLGLASISFMAVFREAFETVLFLRALWIEGGASDKTALGLGVATSFVLIFILAYSLLRFSIRIPIRSLFNVSALLMSVLAVILTGKGLHSLQETGLLPATDSPFNLRIDILGFYPTIETLLPQMAVLILIAFLWLYGKRSNGLKTAS